MASKFEISDDKQQANKPEQKALYDMDQMKKPPLNTMSYDVNKPAPRLDGPKLPDLIIEPSVETNDRYQKFARQAAEFVAINGNFNIDMRRAVKDANENDKLLGGGHKTVDQLLRYMNKEMAGTYFSVIRQRDNIVMLDSRDNQNLKHDAKGNAIVRPRVVWNINKEPYDPRYNQGDTKK